MITYKDPKLGEIRVLNVTEARSHFAQVLSDKDTVYVITKNNKPQRVIINYDDFAATREVSVPLAVTQEPKEEKKPASHLKGMLEVQKELAKIRITQEKKTPPPKINKFDEIVTPPIAKQAQPAATESPIIDEVEPEASEVDILPDYFSTDYDADHDEEGIEIISSPVPEPSQAPVTAFRPIPESVPVKKEIRPEEEDYFNRFKKLYEPPPASFAAPKPIATPKSEMLIPPPPAEIQTSPEVAPTKKVAPTPQKQAPQNTQVPDRNPQIINGNAAPASKTSAKPNVIMEQVKAKEETPSLQDLLKDLENERLSDENENPLDEGQIKDIIQRITHDY